GSGRGPANVREGARPRKARRREDHEAALLDAAGACALRTGESPEQRGESAGLLGTEVLEEQPADAADMGAASVAQLRHPFGGQLRIGNASVTRARHALDEPGGDEAVD